MDFATNRLEERNETNEDINMKYVHGSCASCNAMLPVVFVIQLHQLIIKAFEVFVAVL